MGSVFLRRGVEGHLGVPLMLSLMCTLPYNILGFPGEGQCPHAPFPLNLPMNIKVPLTSLILLEWGNFIRVTSLSAVRKIVRRHSQTDRRLEPLKSQLDKDDISQIMSVQNQMAGHQPCFKMNELHGNALLAPKT